MPADDLQAAYERLRDFQLPNRMIERDQRESLSRRTAGLN